MTKPALLLSAMCLSLGLLFLLHLAGGPSDLMIFQALTSLLEGNENIDALILAEIRLPRSLLAVCIGISLGLSGAALQGLLRNPLASPGLLGISQCAALAAVISLYYGFSRHAWFILPVTALAGAAVAVFLISALTRRHHSITSIILVGIAINAMAGSLISFALNFAPNPYALQEIFYWLLGSIANKSLPELIFALPFMILGWVLIFSARPFLDAMSLGEDTARSLGFDTQRQRLILISGVAACVGAAVAVSGSIGFVGLVVPHLLRPLVGHEPGRLLLFSALGGALLLLLADVTVQQISGAQELQLGVVTAAIGGPFFLFLILRNKSLYP